MRGGIIREGSLLERKAYKRGELIREGGLYNKGELIREGAS